MKQPHKINRHMGWLTSLGVLAVVLLVLGAVQSNRVQALSRQVNAAYQKALYETAALLSGVQLNLEKLLVSGEQSQEQQLLSTIAQQCEGAQGNLTTIPLDPELLGGTLKFVNQTADYSRVLATKLGNNEKLGEQDIRQLITMHDASVNLNAQFSDILLSYEHGDLVFDMSDTAVKAVKDLQQQSQPLVEYPVLLYDGPFSDARQDARVSLTGTNADQSQAQQALINFIGADRVTSASYSGENQILGRVFEYEVNTADGTLTAGVTQIGAHVLYMLPEQANTEVLLSQGECIDMAHRFLLARGYGDMQVSYWRQLGGILTVNFAAQQGDVLLYPDLVKLQVSMKDGLVVGMEAGNYLKNHRYRSLITPVFTEQQALDSLGALLEPQRVRQCLIPVESGEAQCWEVTATVSGGNTYLVYIDCVNGEERSILRVMQEDDGVLTQ